MKEALDVFHLYLWEISTCHSLNRYIPFMMSRHGGSSQFVSKEYKDSFWSLDKKGYEKSIR